MGWDGAGGMLPCSSSSPANACLISRRRRTLPCLGVGVTGSWARFFLKGSIGLKGGGYSTTEWVLGVFKRLNLDHTWPTQNSGTARGKDSALLAFRTSPGIKYTHSCPNKPPEYEPAIRELGAGKKKDGGCLLSKKITVVTVFHQQSSMACCRKGATGQHGNFDETFISSSYVHASNTADLCQHNCLEGSTAVFLLWIGCQ